MDKKDDKEAPKFGLAEHRCHNSEERREQSQWILQGRYFPQKTSLVSCRLVLGSFWHKNKMDRTLSSRPILAIRLETILQEPSEREVQPSISPGHSAELQSVTSVELPSQSWRPGWLQARALIFRPLPQELVHVDQSPHSCQPWATGRISSGERLSISRSSLSLLASWLT